MGGACRLFRSRGADRRSAIESAAGRCRVVLSGAARLRGMRPGLRAERGAHRGWIAFLPDGAARNRHPTRLATGRRESEAPHWTVADKAYGPSFWGPFYRNMM